MHIYYLIDKLNHISLVIYLLKYEIFLQIIKSLKNNALEFIFGLIGH